MAADYNGASFAAGIFLLAAVAVWGKHPGLVRPATAGCSPMDAVF